ncbi:BolA family transcriptional regulator, general stress-responsive regulator [Bathymodiolus japonicus methanotrophic gill symbiont]|uniref:BolA family protein n=1 Tax=Bathymodiolus japonicus methanotrophic gill symbiont TaxID=113269 RepID=UPI001B748967|nr:BolA family protein [Bathymodiolus japonicus methanotrophic gill symbiont]GFO71179.1 BolA family transcriptional regulator, general stress-responsive regulator [Bathymodiolus japonicus methanotrophic gill symbiont]
MNVDLIKSLLTESLAPEQIEIANNSQAHAGHAGAQSGGGNYHVRIVSSAFEGKSLVQRHQLIYKSLGDLMKHEIHALGIDAFTPTESH